MLLLRVDFEVRGCDFKGRGVSTRRDLPRLAGSAKGMFILEDVRVKRAESVRCARGISSIGIIEAHGSLSTAGVSSFTLAKGKRGAASRKRFVADVG